MERNSGEAQEPKAANITRRGPQHDCGASPPPTNVRGGLSRLPALTAKRKAKAVKKAVKKSPKKSAPKAKPRSRTR